jgi:adenylate kinase family enzyme
MHATPDANSSPIAIVLGPPAAGKSTLVRRILLAHPHINRFRVRHRLAEEKRNNTDLWQAARLAADQGTWLPDAIVVELFARWLSQQGAGRILMEGLPANGIQAVRVTELLDARSAPDRRVLYLDAPDAVCVSRAGRRRVCHTCDDGMAPASPDPANAGRCGSCGGPCARREDDTGTVFAERLRIHRRNAPAILAAFQLAQVTVLDAASPPDVIAAAALAALAGDS